MSIHLSPVDLVRKLKFVSVPGLYKSRYCYFFPRPLLLFSPETLDDRPTTMNPKVRVNNPTSY